MWKHSSMKRCRYMESSGTWSLPDPVITKFSKAFWRCAENRGIFSKKKQKTICFYDYLCYNALWVFSVGISENTSIYEKEDDVMKHIKTLNTRTLQNTLKKGGCGECQTSCQSACKTSCTVGNQACEQHK